MRQKSKFVAQGSAWGDDIANNKLRQTPAAAAAALYHRCPFPEINSAQHHFLS
jgi:hypothetical protein